MFYNTNALLLTFLVALSSPAICSSLSRDVDPAPSNQSSPFTYGSDCSLAPEFSGYLLNHFALNVNDLNRSIDFYTNALGMKVLFVYTDEVIPDYQLTYMGHNTMTPTGQPYASCEEFAAHKNTVPGLIELGGYRNSGYYNMPSTELTNSFSHMGLMVPNVTETQLQMQAMGVPILKAVGELPPVIGPGANAYGLGPQQTLHLSAKMRAALQTSLLSTGVLTFCYALDPDGNLIEIQPRGT